jgi:hypothetical protein
VARIAPMMATIETSSPMRTNRSNDDILFIMLM